MRNLERERTGRAEDTRQKEMILSKEGSWVVSAPLLCAKLVDVNNEFKRNVNWTYDDKYFFDDEFTQFLKEEVKSYTGGIGMPGTIAPHIPVHVMSFFRSKLPIHVTKYRDNVYEVCLKTIFKNIQEIFNERKYPKLRDMLFEHVQNVMKEQFKSAKKHLEYQLSLEDEVCTANDDYINTIVILQSQLRNYKGYGDLHNNLHKMRNLDKKMADMHLEIFSYWKLLKKRIIDNVMMVVRYELVTKVFTYSLKSCLVGAVMKLSDHELIALLSPDADTLRERNNIKSRLEKLEKSKDMIEMLSFD